MRRRAVRRAGGRLLLAETKYVARNEGTCGGTSMQTSTEWRGAGGQGEGEHVCRDNHASRAASCFSAVSTMVRSSTLRSRLSSWLPSFVPSVSYIVSPEPIFARLNSMSSVSFAESLSSDPSANVAFSASRSAVIDAAAFALSPFSARKAVMPSMVWHRSLFAVTTAVSRFLMRWKNHRAFEMGLRTVTLKVTVKDRPGVPACSSCSSGIATDTSSCRACCSSEIRLTACSARPWCTSSADSSAPTARHGTLCTMGLNVNGLPEWNSPRKATSSALPACGRWSTASDSPDAAYHTTWSRYRALVVPAGPWGSVHAAGMMTSTLRSGLPNSMVAGMSCFTPARAQFARRYDRTRR
eukprot:Rhum_TRINITY_DN4432_c0_g1::Rhum_TRINITY_DN4432_c0_g1_i1::g.14246::m.14246